ncbi:hypothetical protein HELRODRAFT_171462 [Helobdella robusta]|uniref:Uncharacterized protein n=1 Tax=Helobdella robusta TaxID=6412 RepID=T1F4B3_HELRO|nr:hypothetical protein HELRODRAFT_171462 [Helobdella robusta]ESO05790.1 hypothetical protein HELRODRAFT_171462 [Helobdella robusta]
MAFYFLKQIDACVLAKVVDIIELLGSILCCCIKEKFALEWGLWLDKTEESIEYKKKMQSIVDAFIDANLPLTILDRKKMQTMFKTLDLKLKSPGQNYIEKLRLSVATFMKNLIK